MPFGLTNALATFQTLMQNVLRPLLDRCVIVYINDILVFSKNEKEHETHLHQVFNILWANKLYAKESKCKFFKESVEYLGHIISAEGIAPDLEKVRMIKEWPALKNVTEVQSFTRLCNYYR